MESEICTQCNFEKHINNFYKKYSECQDCNIKRGVKLYYDNKEKYQFNKKNIMTRIEINYYRNKMITETKETQILKNYIDLILNYKTS